METVTRMAERQTGSASGVPTPGPDVARTLSVTAIYLLSENGRKASLLSGGDGRALQQIALQVPATRLHLVSVDKQGVARLKLRPRFEQDGESGIVRTDAAPLYDAPPTIDDLYRAAAKNHELEGAYFAERTAARTTRRDTDQQRRERVAETFLADKGQRAVAHPPPSSKRCYVVTDQGRLLFDVATDQGLAKDVPPEAHRRFRADLRTREDHNRQARAAQLALHEEKKRCIAAWIAANGTDEQQARQAAGVLPMQEAVEAMTDQAFVAINERPLYTRDGAERLQAFLRQWPSYADVVISSLDLLVTSTHAVKATKTQWALVQEIQTARPDASVTLRVHRLAWKQHHEAPALVVFGVLVTCKVGPFTLRREYAAPED